MCPSQPLSRHPFKIKVTVGGRQQSQYSADFSLSRPVRSRSGVLGPVCRCNLTISPFLTIHKITLMRSFTLRTPQQILTGHRNHEVTTGGGGVVPNGQKTNIPYCFGLQTPSNSRRARLLTKGFSRNSTNLKFCAYCMIRHQTFCIQKFVCESTFFAHTFHSPSNLLLFSARPLVLLGKLCFQGFRRVTYDTPNLGRTLIFSSKECQQERTS